MVLRIRHGSATDPSRTRSGPAPDPPQTRPRPAPDPTRTRPGPDPDPLRPRPGSQRGVSFQATIRMRSREWSGRPGNEASWEGLWKVCMYLYRYTVIHCLALWVVFTVYHLELVFLFKSTNKSLNNSFSWVNNNLIRKLCQVFALPKYLQPQHNSSQC